MSPGVDLILTNLSEAATLRRGPIPRVGSRAGDLDVVADPVIAVSAGRFAFVGPRRHARRAVRLRRGGVTVDGEQGTVVPGFVDAHTHAVFAGDRHGEIARKIRGESYVEIARSGGGLF